MKIPVTIITGFLGSGKTTLIANILKSKGMVDRRLAILVNEFGEVSVDGALLRKSSGDCGVEIHDLPNGCICCTVKDDFLPMMKRLQTRKHEIDHIIIETSGLALPTPVMKALAWPEIRNDFQLDAVLTIVDTPELLGGALEVGQPVPGVQEAKGELPSHLGSVEVILNQQLENADVVILNKIDQLNDEALEKAEALVRKKATKVRFLELAFHAELDTRLCLGLNLHCTEETIPHHHDHHHGPVSSVPDVPAKPLENQTQFDGHAHSGLNTHQHGEHTHEHFHEHDTGWQSFVLRSHQPQDAEKVKFAIKEVTLKEPILRAKGFATVENNHHQLILQAVRSRVQSYFDHEDSHESESSIVFIGYHPNRLNTVRMMNELTGKEWQ